jgi:hypothetical protein
MTDDDRKKIRQEAFAEAARAAEGRVADIDAIFPDGRGKVKRTWVSLLRREPRECAARIRALVP